MLTKWLKDRAPRPTNKERSFRPWLESLEDRNAPSGGWGDDHGHGHGHDHGDGGDGGDDNDQGPPPPAVVSSSSSIHSNVNAHDSFNGSTITDSFNNTINVAINLPPAQTTVVGGLLGFTNFLSSALSNPQLGTLMSDEIALGVDTYLTSSPISAMLPSSVVSDLKSDAATLSAAIGSITAQSPIAAAIGGMTYNFTVAALTSAQPTI